MLSVKEVHVGSEPSLTHHMVVYNNNNGGRIDAGYTILLRILREKSSFTSLSLPDRKSTIFCWAIGLLLLGETFNSPEGITTSFRQESIIPINSREFLRLIEEESSLDRSVLYVIIFEGLKSARRFLEYDPSARDVRECYANAIIALSTTHDCSSIDQDTGLNDLIDTLPVKADFTDLFKDCLNQVMDYALGCLTIETLKEHSPLVALNCPLFRTTDRGKYPCSDKDFAVLAAEKLVIYYGHYKNIILSTIFGATHGQERLEPFMELLLSIEQTRLSLTNYGDSAVAKKWFKVIFEASWSVVIQQRVSKNNLALQHARFVTAWWANLGCFTHLTAGGSVEANHRALLCLARSVRIEVDAEKGKLFTVPKLEEFGLELPATWLHREY